VTPPTPVDLSVGDIRSQIAAEWLQIAQQSQWRAYRKPPSFFRMAPSLTPYDLLFPRTWASQIHRPGPTSRRVLPPGEYDRIYRQYFFCIRQLHRMISRLPNFFMPLSYLTSPCLIFMVIDEHFCRIILCIISVIISNVIQGYVRRYAS